METMNNYQITHTIIDMLGFYGGNYALHKVSSEMSTPNMEKTAVFGISDLLIRNGYVLYGAEKMPFSGQMKKNAYISLVSFLVASGVDLLKNKDLKNSLMKNLYLNAIGLVTNGIIDRVIPEKYI